MKHYCAFDIETAKTCKQVQDELELPDERDAFKYPHRMGFGVGVVYDSKTKEFTEFKKGQDMVKFLLDFDGVLVSYNGKRFDIPALLPYMDIDVYNKLIRKPHLDLLENFYARVNGKFRVPLDNIAKHSIGTQKIGSGADAPLLFQEGKIKELMEYCKVDVAITSRILEFGMKNGHIRFWDKYKSKVVELPVNYVGMLKDEV